MSHPARSTLERPDYDGHFVMIPLNKGKFAIVDEADAELVLTGKPWTALRPAGRSWYAQRREGSPSKSAPMQWLIGGRKWLDHVNRNGLDNRRINLRPATHSQNNANRPMLRNNTSGYRGVYQTHGAGKWTAQIRVRGHKMRLGCFDDPVEAARAYNRAAVEAFGEFAALNPV